MKTKEMITRFIEYCNVFRNLSPETQRAYTGDLRQFEAFCSQLNYSVFSPEAIKEWMKNLDSCLKPRSILRKCSSLRSFYRFARINKWIDSDPFSDIPLEIKHTESLPKDISLHNVERILQYAYQKCSANLSPAKHKQAVRNTAIIELLFGTGIRVSELCSLSPSDVDLESGRILIHGKGNKERIVFISNQDAIRLIEEYAKSDQNTILETGYMFNSQQEKRISPETIRSILNSYAKASGVSSHITPHRFRHTFATALVNSDMNLRHIQTLLGHSSIQVTEIYTHVASAHHREMLSEKHPRNHMNISI